MCVGTVCQAGQWCDQSSFPTCEVGCTSDNNCASNDYCDRSSGGGVGVCRPCAAQTPADTSSSQPDTTPDTSTPPEDTASPTPDTTGPSTLDDRCVAAVGEIHACGELSNNDRAALETACRSNEVEDEEKQFLVSCVNGAADCEEKNACLDGGDGGTCAGDTDCDQTPGVFHEICSGGFCTVGCRDDADCGNDYDCEPFTKSCVPGGFDF